MAKSVIIAGLLALGIGLPVGLPYAAGGAITVSMGPAVIEISRSGGVDFDLDVTCINASCPLATLRIASADQRSYPVAL